MSNSTFGVEEYNDIENFFKQRAFAESSTPYDDVCENYDTFMKLLKRYKSKDDGKVDHMDLAITSIYKQLEYGFNRCQDWDGEEFSDHFQYVNMCMGYWRSILIKTGVFKN